MFLIKKTCTLLRIGYSQVTLSDTEQLLHTKGLKCRVNKNNFLSCYYEYLKIYKSCLLSGSKPGSLKVLCASKHRSEENLHTENIMY